MRARAPSNASATMTTTRIPLLAVFLLHCGSEVSLTGAGSAEGGARTPSEPAVDPSDDVTPPPSPKECVSGASECVADRPRRCDDDGRWQVEAACGDSARCRAGACVALAVPSCAAPGAGRSDCGADGDCCASPYVPGGSFFVGTRLVIDEAGEIVSEYDRREDAPRADVSAFRLDAYPVTVGRVRPFVRAVLQGWRPRGGDGVHTHLRGGRGLAHRGGDETGWNPGWDHDLEEWSDAWNAPSGSPQCQSDMTWSDTVGAREKVAANCLNGVAAYAFCIWDQGFLPSWTEWQYAAAAGAEQRTYPWGEDAPTAAHVEVGLASARELGAVDAKPHGRGRWGHWALLGGPAARALDGDAPRDPACSDCYAPGAAKRPSMVLGGYFNSAEVPKSFDYDFSGGPSQYYGIRCARTP